MSREELLKRVSEILGEILDDEGLKLTEQSTADDVPDWDSTNHVRLMVALESELNLHFETNEIGAPDSVGELLDLIEKKLKS